MWLDAGPDEAGRLLLVVHHLVVDTVSWQALVPDLAEAYEALTAGRTPELAAVPTSFRHWARELEAQASGPAGRAARVVATSSACNDALVTVDVERDVQSTVTDVSVDGARRGDLGPARRRSRRPSTRAWTTYC
ncbi:Carrier domain-containing protein OS=Streptomyces fumanus OX=67302 GN=GCM10018772_35720 PE=4 SV=1 [Streptomyces fumanus]